MKPIIPTLFNFTYKVVCIPTGKYYFGVHSTNRIDDGYLGTGTEVRKSIKEHGRRAHVRTILSQHPTREEAVIEERRLVTREVVADPMCMNLQTGGDKNISFSEETILKLKKTPEQRAAISAKRKGKPTFVTEEDRMAQSARVSGKKNGMYGKERPPEWRAEHSAKMKVLMKGKNLGKPNLAVRGSKWFHDPLTGSNKMLKGDAPSGWLPGRFKP